MRVLLTALALASSAFCQELNYHLFSGPTEAYVVSTTTSIPRPPEAASTSHSVIIAVRAADDSAVVFAISGRILLSNGLLYYFNKSVTRAQSGFTDLVLDLGVSTPVKLVALYVTRIHQDVPSDPLMPCAGDCRH